MFLSSQRYCKSFNLRGVNPPHLGPQQPCRRPAGKGPGTRAWEPQSHPHPWLHPQTAHLPPRKGCLGPPPTAPSSSLGPQKESPVAAQWGEVGDGRGQPAVERRPPPTPQGQGLVSRGFQSLLSECWEPPPAPVGVSSSLCWFSPARGWPWGSGLEPLRDTCTLSSETTEKLKKKKKSVGGEGTVKKKAFG